MFLLIIYLLTALIKFHSDNCLFFHCDGAHSTTRELLCQNDVEVTSLFYVCEFSFKVELSEKKTLIQKLKSIFSKSTIKKINFFQHYKIEKKLSDRINLIEQTIKDNLITIRFFVDKNIYDNCKQFTFKHPCSSEIFSKAKQVDPNLIVNENSTDWEKLKVCGIFDLIDFYIKFRLHTLSENLIENTFSMILFKLDCYKTNKCGIKNIEDQQHFFVGDSAFGVPFYRSLRNGLVASSMLCNLIMNIKDEAEFFKNTIENTSVKNVSYINNEAYDEYNTSMKLFYSYELTRVKEFTTLISIKDKLIKISNNVPWQTNFITTKEEGILNSRVLVYHKI